MIRKLLFVSLALLVPFIASCDSNPAELEQDLRPPDFLLSDVDGSAFQLSWTEGKVVLLTFFATWCGACQAEMVVLADLHETYHDQGLEIVAVAVNYDSADEVKAFRDSGELPFLVLLDDGVVSKTGYGVRYVPTNYFIDRDVNMSRSYGSITKEEFVEIIEDML